MTAIKVFVGSDTTQDLPFKVLSYSIHKHTQEEVEVFSLAGLKLPDPKNIQDFERTNFSFSRYAIPQLTEFQGKAIYLDSDMLVFEDIGKLWNLSLDSKVVMALPVKQLVHEPSKRIVTLYETSVMLIDCEKAQWDIIALINALGKEWSYDELMRLLFVPQQLISPALPPEWNHLDHYTLNTKLLHYTALATQPWVDPTHPAGQLWIKTLKEMLEKKLLKLDYIEEQVSLGHVRPSLIKELTDSTLSKEDLAVYDKTLGYIKHRKLQEKEFKKLVNAREAFINTNSPHNKQIVENITNRINLVWK